MVTETSQERSQSKTGLPTHPDLPWNVSRLASCQCRAPRSKTERSLGWHGLGGARFCQFKHGNKLREKPRVPAGRGCAQESRDRDEDAQGNGQGRGGQGNGQAWGAPLRLKNHSNVYGYFYFSANRRLEASPGGLVVKILCSHCHDLGS